MNALGNPWALALLAPVALCAWRMLRRTRSVAAVPFPAISELPRRVSWRQRVATLPPILFTAALALAVFALARPQSATSHSGETKEAIAIEMAVDISGSMRAGDFATAQRPNLTRLDVVKETFREFVDKRPDDLIGLVAFGGYATTRCPLTFDHDALAAVLAETRIPGDDGEPVEREELQTSIGDGLATACARLMSASNVATRVVVLLSDGVHNFGSCTPDQAADLAKSQGIKVYAIGAGADPEAARAAAARQGGLAGLFASLGRAEDEIDEAALRRIASKTGGRYFRISSRKGLEKALEEIDGLEKTEVQSVSWSRRTELYAPWLAAAIVLFAAALLLAGGGRRSLI